MPIQIDCPDCGGRGEVHTIEGEHFAEIAVQGRHQFKGDLWEKCPNCTDGKITVYTEAEVFKMVESQLSKACAEERERIGDFIQVQASTYRVGTPLADELYKLAEAIRSMEGT